MPPVEFVEALYQTCLGRAADPSGLAHHVEALLSSGDPTLILRGILDSREYAARRETVAAMDCSPEISQALAFLDRRLRVVDVGAQSLGPGSHPYDPLSKVCDLDIIGFDPLSERLRERAEAEASPGLTLLPYAIGDGEYHTLYVNDDDATSSLFPLNVAHNARFVHLSELHTVRTEQVKTHRLDDVLPDGRVDFLKLDVQGSELMVLKGAEQTLSRTAVIHTEVLFSPIYLNQPLFVDVQQHLTVRGFTLIDLLLPGRYSYRTPSGRNTPDYLIWGDAIYFRDTEDPATQRLQALVAASVYRKPTLAEHLLLAADQSQPRPDSNPKRSISRPAIDQDKCTPPLQLSRPEENPLLTDALPMRQISVWQRVEMTASCRDTDQIPKVAGAGGVFSSGSIPFQLMHNGLRVVAGGYHGEWMSEVIRRLRGHHEPQEELLFHTTLPLMTTNETNPVMIELGAFWGYYSLWFRSIFRQARNILVEPDPGNLLVGRRNFELNGYSAEYLEAAVGVHNGSSDFHCESDGLLRRSRTISVDGLVRDLGIERINLLHADIQGAELSMLDGSVETIDRGKLDWLFLSTHHHSISGDPLTHQRCLNWLRTHGACIIDEHSVSESFSGDGLIVAAFSTKNLQIHSSISRNVPSRALFRRN
jgi:FkbM family methyltransferase